MASLKTYKIALVAALVVIVVLAGLSTYYILLAPPGAALEKVEFLLDAPVYPRHSVLFMAKEKGFYEEVGLDVDVLRGYGTLTTIETLEKGLVEFGAGDASMLVPSRAEGMKVKALFMLIGVNPWVIWAPKENQITTPQDLEGKKTYWNPGWAACKLFPVFCETAGIDYGSIGKVTGDPAARMPALLAGELDFLYGYYVSDMPTMAGQGIECDYEIWFKDYGLNFNTGAIFTTDKMIEDNPDLVRRFIEGTIKGILWALDNQEETAQIFSNLFPEITLEMARLGIQGAAEVFWSDMATTADIPGWTTYESWKITRDLIADAYEIDRATVPVADLYTTQFLEEIYGPPKA